MKLVKKCPVCSSKKTKYERRLNGFELIRCSSCSFVYVNDTDSVLFDANKCFDKADENLYAETQSFIDILWFDVIVKKLSLRLSRKNKSVLDVGCGNGVLLGCFKQQGWKISGVDISPWAKKAAKQVGFTFYSGFVERAKIPKHSFDAITSTSTLEHVPNPLPHISSSLDLLSKGGIAYYSGMPNYGSLAVRLGLSSFHHNIPPRHVSYFTKRSLKKLLQSKELRSKTVRVYIRSYGIPELHKVYNIFFKSSNTKSNSHQSKKKKSSLKLAIYKFIVHINYFLGRPFGLGDKLEVVMIKK